jgi:hypothetical protein
MKGFLIFLALAVPVVLASPFFWSLVQMEWGAERVGYTYHDGVTQWAMLGPKAPWPKWALVPEGAKLTVRAGYEAAPGHAAIGYGELDGKMPPRDVEQRYEGALRAAGWTVQVGRFDSTYPEIPPRPLHWCIVQAQRGHQVLQMSVDMDEPRTVGRLHWSEGGMALPTGAKEGACWRT